MSQGRHIQGRVTAGCGAPGVSGETARAMVPSARYEGVTLGTSQLSWRCVCLLLAVFPEAHLSLLAAALTSTGEEGPRRRHAPTRELVWRKTLPALSHSGGRPERTTFPAPSVGEGWVQSPELSHEGSLRPTTWGMPEFKSSRGSGDYRCTGGRQNERQEVPSGHPSPNTCCVPGKDHSHGDPSQEQGSFLCFQVKSFLLQSDLQDPIRAKFSIKTPRARTPPSTRL